MAINKLQVKNSHRLKPHFFKMTEKSRRGFLAANALNIDWSRPKAPPTLYMKITISL